MQAKLDAFEISIPLWYDKNNNDSNYEIGNLRISIPLWYDKNFEVDEKGDLIEKFQFHFGTIKTLHHIK